MNSILHPFEPGEHGYFCCCGVVFSRVFHFVFFLKPVRNLLEKKKEINYMGPFGSMYNVHASILAKVISVCAANCRCVPSPSDQSPFLSAIIRVNLAKLVWSIALFCFLYAFFLFYFCPSAPPPLPPKNVPASGPSSPENAGEISIGVWKK